MGTAMLYLIIDTATIDCSACIWDSTDYKIRSSKTISVKKGHGEILFSILNNVLAAADVTFKDIGKIITSTGPGNFTGLRVGISTARGLGLGLEIPVIGLSNLAAILFEDNKENKLKSNHNQLVMLNAGRNQLHCLANFNSKYFSAGIPFTASILQVNQMMDDCAAPTYLSGNGVKELSRSFPQNSFVLSEKSNAEITSFAKLDALAPIDNPKPSPLYLRPPDASPQMGFSVERV